MKIIVDRFESIEDFIQTATTSKRNKPSSKESYTSEHARKSWAGSKSLKHTLEIAKNGYELDKIDSQIDSLKATESQYEMESVFSVSGGDPDLGLYMSGEPECMIDFTAIEANKFVHLVIGVTEGAGTSSEQILNRATAVCSVIDRLENRKYRVRLSMGIVNVNFNSKERITNCTIVKIKDYKEPMSIAEVAGVLHTGFYRRMIFRYWEGHKDFNQWHGYGSVGSENDAIRILRKEIDDDFLYLPSVGEKSGGSDSKGMMESFSDIESAERYAEYVDEHIETLTIKR